MLAGKINTGLGRLSPRTARTILLIAAAAAVSLMAVTLSPLKSGFADAPNRGPGDVELYKAEADRIRAGESYYQAIARELRARGYPTRSIFNWRAPLPVWLIGVLPDDAIGKVLLGAAAIGLILLAFSLAAREGTTAQGYGGTVLLIGALLPIALGDLFVMPELWSGVLVALSVAAYGCQRSRLGTLGGLAALFVRELAAPYCLVCFVMALVQRRRGETLAWLGGFAGYALYYAVHIAHVLPLIGVADTAHAQGWIRFGGAGFVISTVQMNAYLLLLPQWITAIYLTAAMVGFAGWQTAAGTRAGVTAALFLIAFAIVGQPFNQYWGSMIAPLLALGVARFPAAVMDLLSAAGWIRPAVNIGGASQRS